MTEHVHVCPLCGSAADLHEPYDSSTGTWWFCIPCGAMFPRETGDAPRLPITQPA